MTTAALGLPRASWLPFQMGRSFVHPLFDYLLIGGGLSLATTAFLVWGGAPLAASALTASLPVLLLFNNSAHFAASTVRLYTKPGAFRELPFLTLVLPLATVGVLTTALFLPGSLGKNLLALYLTWSPYHYAAQAFGLALMYCYRSGCELTLAERRLLRVACLAPFLFAFFNGRAAGLEWFVSASFLAQPAIDRARALVVSALMALSFALPLVFLLRPVLLRRTPVPLISVLLVLSNGVWWITLVYLDSFVWATIFHGIQYLCIVVIFHVRERLQAPSNQYGWLHHAAWFYGCSLALGYLLFQAWPLAYVAAGFTFAESMLLVTAVVNVHHFVVDAYIWRLRRDSNYRVVTGTARGALA